MSGALAQAGFSHAQARRFIPEAVRELVGASPDQDLVWLLDQEAPQQAARLIAALDISAMAARLGIHPDMAGAGVAALIPEFLGLIKERNLAHLVSLLGEGGMGSVDNLVKGLFH